MRQVQSILKRIQDGLFRRNSDPYSTYGVDADLGCEPTLFFMEVFCDKIVIKTRSLLRPFDLEKIYFLEIASKYTEFFVVFKNYTCLRTEVGTR